MRYGEETIEQVRQAADLLELIGPQVALRKVGQRWKGLCPFHGEKTPSFMVNPERQAYHCFGCGAGGDCFRWVMETEKLSFVEAVQTLAERFGVTLPQAAEEDSAGRLYQALEDAATFYRRTLEDREAGKDARAYLAGRGFADEELLARFGVGLAPAGWDGLAQRLVPRFGMAVLLEAGLVLKRERGEGVYDRFRGRVVVPLRLPSGKTIGFGGRALGDETPKYLNSPETPVYRKGKFLFGLDLAKKAIRDGEDAVLVEGYFDVIGLAQAGIEEVVATAGTALTLDQCRLLRRSTPAVSLVFDGDAAGQAAAEKALSPCVQAGLRARVVILPTGDDPDTLVQKGGRGAFDALRAKARSPIEFLAERHADDREAALKAAAALAALAEDPIVGGLLVEEAARTMAFDARALSREVELRRTGRTAVRPVPRAATAPAAGASAGVAPAAIPRTAHDDRAARALEADFLAVLVAHPELLAAAAAAVDPAWFRSAAGRGVAELLLGPERRSPQAGLGDPDLAPEARSLLSALCAEAPRIEGPERALLEGVVRMKKRAFKDDLKLLQAELGTAVAAGAPAGTIAALQGRVQDTAAALRDVTSEAWRKETE